MGSHAMLVKEFEGKKYQVLKALGLDDDKSVSMLNGYPVVYLGDKTRYVHRLVYELYSGDVLTTELVVHHKDHDRTNFEPENLEMMTRSEHNRAHPHCGEDNHFYGRKHTEEARRKIAEYRRGRKLSKETRQKIAEAVRDRAAKRGRDERGRFYAE